MLEERVSVRSDPDLEFLVARGLRSADRMRETIVGLMDYAALQGNLSPLRIDLTDANPSPLRAVFSNLSPTRASIFDLMTRGTTEVAGHGIGLATCAAIVSAHGGSIGVDPAAGGGSCFWFELPTTDVTADAASL